ncbi:unnamed protein product, partial [Closterium sp. NIES-53]
MLWNLGVICVGPVESQSPPLLPPSSSFSFFPTPPTTALPPSPLSLHTLLTNLFPEDSGLLFPNMAKEPLARESGFVAALPARLSRPYYWAQLMCGLDFLPPLPPSFLLPSGSSAAAGAADVGGAAGGGKGDAGTSAVAAMEIDASAAASASAAAPTAPTPAGTAVAAAREGGAAEAGPGVARAQLLERLEAFREERRLGRVLQAMRERVTAARELNAVLSSLVTSRLPTITPSHATVGPYSSGPWPEDSGYLPQCSILSWQLLIGPLGFPNAKCSSQIGGKAEEGDLASGKGGEKRGKERRGEGRSEREGEKDRSDMKGDEKKGEEKKGDERKGDERKGDEKKGDERKGEKGSGEDGSSRGRGEGTGRGKGRDEAAGRLAVGGFGRESSLPVGGLGGEGGLLPGVMLAQALVIAQRRRLGGLAGAVGLGGVAGLAGISELEGGSGRKGEGGGKKRESEGKSSGRERRSSREGKEKSDEDGEKGRGGGSKRETEGKAAASGAIAVAAGTEAAAEGPAGDGQGRGGSGGSGGSGGVEGGEGVEGVVWVALPWSWAAAHGIHPSTPAAVSWETVLGAGACVYELIVRSEGGGGAGGGGGSGGSGERKGMKEEGERGVCYLQALVVIYPDFPRRPPLFSLHLLSPTTSSAHQQPLLPSSTAQVTLTPSASPPSSHASSLLDGLFSLESE